MTSPTTAARGRLTPEREAEVYVVVLDELARNGVGRLNLDEVARRARCSKATLYRLWEGKDDLVMAALRHARHTAIADPTLFDTGSLRGDMHAWAHHFAAIHETFARLVLSVAHSCLADPALARVVREHLVPCDSAPMNAIIARAVARGEIAPACPAIPLVEGAVVGPLLLHHLFSADPLSADDLIQFMDAVVLPALGAA